jgi:hypothetical protein
VGLVALKPVPRQPNFTPEKEEWGQILLEDDSIIDLRFILTDVVITGEDMLGPQPMLGYMVGIRARSSPEIMEKVKDKPPVPEPPPPLTAADGYEAVKIKKTEKPVRSSYFFEEYLLIVELNVEAVARNTLYKSPNGNPPYNLRWTLRHSVSKATT